MRRDTVPRERRRESSTGIYHIVLQGQEGLGLFREEKDCRSFQYLLDSKLEDMGNVDMECSYMGKNHFHAIIRTDYRDMSDFCSRLSSSYAWAYNEEHNRRGSIFARRFLSEPIENSKEYEQVIQYLEKHRRNAHWRMNPFYEFENWREEVDRIPVIMDVPADLHRQKVTIFARIAIKEMRQMELLRVEELVGQEKIWIGIQKEAKRLFGYSRDFNKIVNDFLRNGNKLAPQLEKGYNKKQKSTVEANHILPKKWR